MEQTAFVKIEDHWQLTSDPNQILNADTAIFVDEDDFCERELQNPYNSARKEFRRPYPYEVFEEKYLALRPDNEVELILKYPLLKGNHKYFSPMGSPDSYNIAVFVPNSKSISDKILNRIAIRIQSRDPRDEISLSETCAFISNELNGTLTGNLENENTVYINKGGLLKRSAIAHRGLESLTREFNKNGFHLNVEIKASPEPYECRTVPGGLSFKLEENPIAAAAQLEAINKMEAARAARIKKPAAKAKNKKPVFKFSQAGFAAIINFLSNDLKQRLDHFNPSDDYSIINYYWGNERRKTGHTAVKAAVIFEIHNRFNGVTFRRKQLKWQQLMYEWRHTPHERKLQMLKVVEIEYAERIIRAFDLEARRTPNPKKD